MVAISGILSQGPLGKELPVAFISRTLQPAETRYSTTEKEMLAIFWGIRQLRCYLLGVQFVVFSDHKPLQWIFKMKDSFSRIFRWRMQLAEYDFVIIYKPGKLNLPADCLSRYVPENTSNSNVNSVGIHDLECNVLTRAATRKREEMEVDKSAITMGATEIESNEWKVLIDEQKYENCLLFMDKFKDLYVNNLIEKNAVSKKIENEIMFVLKDAIVLMKSDIVSIANNLFLQVDNGIYIPILCYNYILN